MAAKLRRREPVARIVPGATGPSDHPLVPPAHGRARIPQQVAHQRSQQVERAQHHERCANAHQRQNRPAQVGQEFLNRIHAVGRLQRLEVGQVHVLQFVQKIVDERQVGGVRVQSAASLHAVGGAPAHLRRPEP